MSAMASQITDDSIVCSSFCFGTDPRRHQSSTSLAFVRGIHRLPVDSPHKGFSNAEKLPFDDVIMLENGAILFTGGELPSTFPPFCYFPPFLASSKHHWHDMLQHSCDTIWIKQGKSEGFDSCDRPSNLTHIGFKSSIFQPVWPWKFDGWPPKTIGHLFYATSSFLHHFVAIGEFKLEFQSINA